MSNLIYKIPCEGNGSEQRDIVTNKNKLRTKLAGHKSDQKYRNCIGTLPVLCPFSGFCDHMYMENYSRQRYMMEMLQIIKAPRIRGLI